MKVSVCRFLPGVKVPIHPLTHREEDTSALDIPGNELFSLTLVMIGGGHYVPAIFYLFFYSKSLPQTKPLDPPVNS